MSKLPQTSMTAKRFFSAEDIYWWMGQARIYLGKAGMLAVILSICLIFYAVFWVFPQSSSIERGWRDLKKEALQVRALQSQGSMLNLPPANNLVAHLEKMYAILQEQGFAVNAATYQQVVADKSGLRRLNADIPLTGTYPNFLIALTALSQQPGVRIDTFGITRKNIDTQIISVRLRLSMLGVAK